MPEGCRHARPPRFATLASRASAGASDGVSARVNARACANRTQRFEECVSCGYFTCMCDLYRGPKAPRCSMTVWQQYQVSQRHARGLLDAQGPPRFATLVSRTSAGTSDGVRIRVNAQACANWGRLGWRRERFRRFFGGFRCLLGVQNCIVKPSWEFE